MDTNITNTVFFCVLSLFQQTQLVVYESMFLIIRVIKRGKACPDKNVHRFNTASEVSEFGGCLLFAVLSVFCEMCWDKFKMSLCLECHSSVGEMLKLNTC